MKHKILMTLALLITAATGAWADGETATITLTSGQTVKTYENVTLPWSTTADILKEVITDYKNVASNIDAITGGDGKVVKYGSEQFTVNGTFSGEAKVVVSWYNSSTQYATITVTAPRPLMTLSDDGKTATMESMPASDVTVNYELVRDMSVQMTTTVGGVTDNSDYRIRLQKDGSKWALAELTVDQVKALFKVHDAIENKDLACSGDGAVCTIRIYALDDNNQLAAQPTDYADLEPGRYVAIAKAVDGSAYDGQTAQSNVIVLFQGYEVIVPSKEYITYYKDEPLYADPQTSADAELYTISSVSGDQAVLSDAIATAPSNTPLLIYNAGNTDQTFLLIPADAEPNLQLTVYGGFKGTLVDATINASDANTTNYALNGIQFVYVKDAISVKANKCWLEVPTSNARALTIVSDSEATGIRSMDNGQLIMDNWYDLNGRKLQGKPTRKGIYLQNGQKVVVK